jgi:hypothetical protein
LWNLWNLVVWHACWFEGKPWAPAASEPVTVRA